MTASQAVGKAAYFRVVGNMTMQKFWEEMADYLNLSERTREIRKKSFLEILSYRYSCRNKLTNPAYNTSGKVRIELRRTIYIRRGKSK